jgi:hypothetical protein
MKCLARYANALSRAQGNLVLISDDKHLLGQFAITGVTQAVCARNVYTSGEWLGATGTRANLDAHEWVKERAKGR